MLFYTPKNKTEINNESRNSYWLSFSKYIKWWEEGQKVSGDHLKHLCMRHIWRGDKCNICPRWQAQEVEKQTRELTIIPRRQNTPRATGRPEPWEPCQLLAGDIQSTLAEYFRHNTGHRRLLPLSNIVCHFSISGASLISSHLTLDMSDCLRTELSSQHIGSAPDASSCPWLWHIPDTFYDKLPRDMRSYHLMISDIILRTWVMYWSHLAQTGTNCFM